MFAAEAIIDRALRNLPNGLNILTRSKLSKPSAVAIEPSHILPITTAGVA